MSYTVEHVRFTLECDACGITEKRDRDANPDHKAAIVGWGEVRVREGAGCVSFCCPGCLEQVTAILTRRAREAEEARLATEAACEHDYQQRGLLKQCTKCKKWKP